MAGKYESFQIQEPSELAHKLRESTCKWKKSRTTGDRALKFLDEKCTQMFLRFCGVTPRNESNFFHAVSQQMVRCGIAPQNASALRSNLVQYMKKHHLIKVINGKFDLRKCVNMSWEEYLAEMSEPWTWADEVAVVAMAHYLKKNIMIITSFNWSATEFFFILCGPPNKTTEPPLLLGHYPERFYQCLEPIQPQSASPARSLTEKSRPQSLTKMPAFSTQEQSPLTMISAEDAGQIYLPSDVTQQSVVPRRTDVLALQARLEKVGVDRSIIQHILEQDRRDRTLRLSLAVEDPDQLDIVVTPEGSVAVGTSTKKYDLSKLTSAELRDALITSYGDVGILDACSEELHRRLTLYNTRTSKKNERPTNVTQEEGHELQTIMTRKAVACRDPADLWGKLRQLNEYWRMANITQNQCLDLLQQKCSDLGLECSGQTPQNESSFFHAISEQLAQCGLPQQSAYDLRLRLVADMRRYPQKKGLDTEIDLSKFEVGNWPRYLCQMENPELMADEVAIVAMAHYLTKDIMVIPSFEWSSAQDSFVICGPPYECHRPMLIIGHVCEKYFQSVTQKRHDTPPAVQLKRKTYKGALTGKTLPVDIQPPKLESGSGYTASSLTVVPRATAPPYRFQVIREKVPTDVYQGGKYAEWQVELFHKRARTRDFSPDTSFEDLEDADVRFKFEDSTDARLLNIDRNISLIRDNIRDKRLQIWKLPSGQSKDLEAYKEVLLEDIRELEAYITGLEQEQAQLRFDTENSAIAPQREAEIEDIIQQEMMKLVPQRVRSDPDSLTGTLQKHAMETRNDPRSLSEQVRLPRFHSKFEWITGGLVDFVSQFEMIRDIVGARCSVQTCPEFQHISALLTAAASYLDDEHTNLPVLRIRGYPDSFMGDAKVVFQSLCEVFVHFYKQHLPKIDPSRNDVTHIGLHFYAFAKTYYLVDDQLLDALISSFS